MPVESIQCPNCGAGLQVESGDRSAVCRYCGTGLRITRGTSGRPVAVLGAISVDTGILAREAAFPRLEERLQSLLSQQEHYRELQRKLKSVKTRQGGVSLLLLGVSALAFYWLFNSSRCVLLIGIVLMLVGVTALWDAQSDPASKVWAWRENDLRAEIEELESLKLDEQIEQVRRRMTELKAEIDGLTEEL